MDPYEVNQDGQSFNNYGRAFDEKFCENCGNKIKKKEAECPFCGTKQAGQISKTALLLITFFLGGIGGHKFYTKKNGLGVLYLLFFWTGIPGLIAFIEFIIYAFTSSEKLKEKYSSGGGGVVIAAVAGFFGIFFLMGILAAIAIPNFVSYRNKAYESQVKSELVSFINAQQEFYSVNSRFTRDMNELEFSVSSPKVSIQITGMEGGCFEVQGNHSELNKDIYMDCNGVELYQY